MPVVIGNVRDLRSLGGFDAAIHNAAHAVDVTDNLSAFGGAEPEFGEVDALQEESGFLTDRAMRDPPDSLLYDRNELTGYRNAPPGAYVTMPQAMLPHMRSRPSRAAINRMSANPAYFASSPGAGALGSTPQGEITGPLGEEPWYEGAGAVFIDTDGRRVQVGSDQF